MISDDVKKNISEWIKNCDSAEPKNLELFAINHCRKVKITNWNDSVEQEINDSFIKLSQTVYAYASFIVDKNTEDCKNFMLNYILKSNINFNLNSEINKVIKHTQQYYVDEKIRKSEKGNKIQFDDKNKDQSSNQNSFELSIDEIFPSDLNDDTESDATPQEVNKTMPPAINPKEPESNTLNFTNDIESLPFPFEVIEILKELENKAYKSPVLSNLESLGRLRLLRKAKILAYLNCKKIIF